jgi:hypothetical protein
MTKLLNFQAGKKTYTVMAAGLALGIAQGFGVHIPGGSAIDFILLFLGGATLRKGVQVQAAQTAADIAKLIQMLEAGAAAPDEVDPNSDTTGATVKDVPVEVHVLQPVPQ